ncbi:hypothetical protein HZU40_11910 [Mycolicibacterium fluoranthenivorans]|uniref:Uncharacterized protein n=1 Tax=Mycolicibacterium fluoranthenivorans TaxID=258505 RepID=A0A7G8PKL7_9MYCO|nr:hypothetical protein [Mycolicibacterium fluoranthenivorans]QNJ94883.1 hypothetical protein HZU40_11910 [Mycolicibacterium fluoranthenivorans]
MLSDVGDAARLIELILDTARQERLLDFVGGDISALDEIDEAHQLICIVATPDLTSSYRLARRRATLIARGANIPDALPAVWAALEHDHRAKALYDVMPPNQRDRAAVELARLGVYVPTTHARMALEIAEIASERGDSETASDFLDAARDASTVVDFHQVIRIACLIAQLKGIDTACDTLAAELDEPADRTYALIKVGWAAVERNDLAAWETVATRLAPPPPTAVMAVAAAVGQIDTEWRRADTVTTLARIAYVVEGAVEARTLVTTWLESPSAQAEALAYVAELAIASSDQRGASKILDEATAVASLIEDEHDRNTAHVKIATAWAKRDDFTSANTVLRQVTKPEMRAKALAKHACIAIDLGRHDRGEELIAEAADQAREVTAGDLCALLLVSAADAATYADNLAVAQSMCREAMTSARSAPLTTMTSMVQRDIVFAAVRAGDLGIIDSSGELFEERPELGLMLMTELTGVGAYDVAYRVAATLVPVSGRPTALTYIARSLVAMGRMSEALSAAQDAEALSRAYVDPYSQSRALSSIAAAEAEAGEHTTARTLCKAALLSALAS